MTLDAFTLEWRPNLEFTAVGLGNPVSGKIVLHGFTRHVSYIIFQSPLTLEHHTG
jgi:hypothetical protein